jgi:FPC/CPF motif-containing protein YcgG
VIPSEPSARPEVITTMAYKNPLMPFASVPPAHPAGLSADLQAFIQSDRFPCAGARSALRLDQVSLVEGGDLLSDECDAHIHAGLSQFGRELDPDSMPFKTLVCGFRRGSVMDEKTFETALWARLQRLHEIDRLRGVPWAPNVSPDPASPEFGISINGVAYFVIGLHPGASRAARRFCRPALVFNSHDQFEQLRADGRYQALQKVIRQKERDVNGSINRMIGTHGQRNQAAQYSGRQVGDDWTCPFQFKAPTSA